MSEEASWCLDSGGVSDSRRGAGGGWTAGVLIVLSS